MERNLSNGEIRSEAGEVRGYVRELISKVLGLPPAEIDAAELLSNYGVNSIDLIDVAVKLEAKYSIQFNPDTMKDLTCRTLSENVLTSLGSR